MKKKKINDIVQRQVVKLVEPTRHSTTSFQSTVSLPKSPPIIFVSCSFISNCPKLRRVSVQSKRIRRDRIGENGSRRSPNGRQGEANERSALKFLLMSIFFVIRRNIRARRGLLLLCSTKLPL